MKAKVFVTLKPSVLDPQGKAIHHSIELLGFKNLADIRQGKYFEITFSGETSPEEARKTAESVQKICLRTPSSKTIAWR